ncbi:probable peroxisomal acyl-coenzyme A oxidase 1 [Calliphora vicina]|uniref:probable peroxisomal acyl-coenzyme A oxidase 1 n=1 Tax=Calliphora vicina TaxID=7373 RepID=UPI00325BE79F
MHKITIPKTINPDIDIERKNASFNTEEFAAWFYGNKRTLEMKRLIEEELYQDLDDSLDHEFASYEDMATMAVKHAVHASKKLRELQNRLNPGGSEIYPLLTSGPVGGALMPAGNPLAVHIVMFTRALKGQGTKEQYEMFGHRADNCEILGTYAQTELGHGTYLRGLETRADYDHQTQEFILNTPTLTSYKWWPGGLGHVCNYCIVVAQLYIDGVSKGIQMFVLQVRDEDSHMPMPGVHIGEIGKKIGVNGINNGFLGLKNVRVPRLNMLMKNQQVLPDGSFVKSSDSKLSYFPMVYVRCMVALANAFTLAQAATIATRYSVVRRQSPIEENEPEPKILEHLTQQMKVLPEIATAVAYRLAAGSLLRLYEQTSQDIAEQDFSRLPELHALACILKVSCSYDSAYGIERMRQGCGGHGYLTAANMGNLFTLATAACTYEGENTVLYLQVGKILIKSWSDVLAGKKLMPTLSYLSEGANWHSFPKWLGSWSCLVKALQYACVGTTRIAHRNYNARLGEGLSQPNAFNNTALVMTRAAELHGRAFVSSNFHESVVNDEAKNKRSPEFQKVLENLLELYLLHTFFRHLGDILRFVPLGENEIDSLQARLEKALKTLRPDAVALVDGFDFHDRVLSSALGSYDGHVYERLFEAALKHPLNQTPVPKFFDLHLKPFMRENALAAKSSKL